MGCDIHYVIECKCSDHWVGLTFSDYLPWDNTPGAHRNYMFFAALAGVRGSGPEPLGLPEDMSDLTKYVVDKWGDDGHSHSFISFKDFVFVFINTNAEAYHKMVKGRLTDSSAFRIWLSDLKHALALGAIYTEEMNEDDMRIVFWFDN